MSRTATLDASALLAWLQDEPGAELVDPHIETSVISSVNWAEVVQRVQRHKPELAPGLRADIEALGIEVIPFGADDAELAALLHGPTMHKGLSLGDRACLALAQRLELPVLTADTAWKQIDVGVSVLLIR